MISTEETSSSINLYQKKYGSGDPILCVHGLGANIFTWRHFVTPFSQENKLILVDLRGFGSSPKPENNRYSIEEHADDIYRIILRDDLKKLTLIGNSLGGAIALLVALRLCEQDPTRLSKLVLIDAGAYKEYLPGYLKLMRSFLGKLIVYLAPSKLAARFVLKASYYDKKKITGEQVSAYALPIASEGGRHALLQTARQCIPANSDEIIAKLNSVSVPTLILWGRQDGVIPLKVAELLNQALPDSKLEVIEQCGHIPQEEKPEETIANISRFMNARPR
ncbi:MAG: alpha/beta hydrolase [Acidobacteriota bacterium]|nr:alpha/beta hydrolase [Acidobacteriota bacterium]